ncbi:acyl-CoA thioesterase [Streptomyces sp. NPDC002896]|uniref:acyl-CoA thioesterase n=1 Tax=Streptomyces sp. NPDC002896 TaxID=3154438 RepID=UPI003321038F
MSRGNGDEPTASRGTDRAIAVAVEYTDPFRHRLWARWSDYDALGHVNASRYLTFLEEARDAWLGETLGLGGADYVVASMQIDFRQPIPLQERDILVELRPLRAGRTSITIDEVVLGVDGTVMASAQATLVLWDPEAGAAKPLSPHDRVRMGLPEA